MSERTKEQWLKELAHYVDCSVDGISEVPRQALVELRLFILASAEQAVADRCAQLAELYRDEHAISRDAEEACSEIAAACRGSAAPMSEREAFEACLAAGVFDEERVSDFHDCETEAAWRGFQAGRASLAASAGSVVDVSDGPGCVMHMPTADEIDKLRDEARRVSRAGVEWIRIEERAEVLANLADLALAGLAASAGQEECAYALIGRQLISSGLYDRMADADSNDEAAGLISELVSVVDPILSTKYERHNAAPTPTCTHPVCSAPGICVRTGKCQFEERDAAEGKS